MSGKVVQVAFKATRTDCRAFCDLLEFPEARLEWLKDCSCLKRLIQWPAVARCAHRAGGVPPSSGLSQLAHGESLHPIKSRKDRIGRGAMSTMAQCHMQVLAALMPAILGACHIHCGRLWGAIHLP